jgi:hypothetical protein
LLHHDDTIRTGPVTGVIGSPECRNLHTRRPRSFWGNSDNRERISVVDACLSAIAVAARGPESGAPSRGPRVGGRVGADTGTGNRLRHVTGGLGQGMAWPHHQSAWGWYHALTISLR